MVYDQRSNISDLIIENRDDLIIESGVNMKVERVSLLPSFS